MHDDGTDEFKRMFNSPKGEDETIVTLVSLLFLAALKSGATVCMLVPGSKHVIVSCSDGEKAWFENDMPVELYPSVVEKIITVANFGKPKTTECYNPGSLILAIKEGMNCKARFDVSLIPGPTQKILVLSITRWPLT